MLPVQEYRHWPARGAALIASILAAFFDVKGSNHDDCSNRGAILAGAATAQNPPAAVNDSIVLIPMNAVAMPFQTTTGNCWLVTQGGVVPTGLGNPTARMIHANDGPRGPFNTFLAKPNGLTFVPCSFEHVIDKSGTCTTLPPSAQGAAHSGTCGFRWNYTATARPGRANIRNGTAAGWTIAWSGAQQCEDPGLGGTGCPPGGINDPDRGCGIEGTGNGTPGGNDSAENGGSPSF